MATVDTLNPAQADDLIRRTVAHWLATASITQDEFASKVGHTQAWLSRYLRGEFNADLTTLVRMAKAMTCTVDDLLFGFEPVGDTLTDELINEIVGLRQSDKESFLNLLRSLNGKRPRPASTSRPRRRSIP